jgi:ubiquinone/menaquinone biosynthesis C-methylase UbiE
MNKIIKQIPLYRFLSFCAEMEIEKKVLDCGAGGDCPPLSLFCEYGFETCGIEYDQKQADLANEFGSKNGHDLNIWVGDMRNLELDDESFGCVYSYNSIFHMTKVDVKKSMDEMKRVLKKDGLMFVNFLSTEDHRYGEGPKVGDNEFEQIDYGQPVIHSYYEASEAENYFTGLDVLYKENRVLERIYEGKKIRQGFIDYILQKK